MGKQHFQIGEWGREYGDAEAKPFRLNDGTLTIRKVSDEDDRRRVNIPRVADIKRSAPYDAPDAAQMALARRVVALLNLAERGEIPADQIQVEINRQARFAEESAALADRGA